MPKRPAGPDGLKTVEPIRSGAVTRRRERRRRARRWLTGVGRAGHNVGAISRCTYNGAYKYLTTLIGIPSNASNAVGNAMTITFHKDGSATQLSSPVTVSLDHRQSVHLNLQGSSQLEISCSAIKTTSQQPVCI